MSNDPNDATSHPDAETESQDTDVDEASEESFPASDPPSYGAPETGAERD